MKLYIISFTGTVQGDTTQSESRDDELYSGRMNEWAGLDRRQESLVSRRSFYGTLVRWEERIWHGRSEVEQEVRLSKRPSNRGGRMLRLLIKTCPRMWSSRRHEFVNFQHCMCYRALCSLRPGLVYATQDRGHLVNTHTHTHRLSVRCPVQLWTVTLDIHSYRLR